MYPKKMKKENNNLRSLTDKELEIRRCNLIDKIARLFTIKYGKLFSENNYDPKKDLNVFLTKDLLFNFDYEKFILKVEKEICAKLQTRYDRINSLGQHERNEWLEREKENTLSSHKNINSLVAENTRNNNHIYTDNENIYYSLEHTNIPSTNITHNQVQFSPSTSPFHKKTKLEDLKNIKEKDDWAIIAKKNYEKAIEEQKNKSLSKEKQNKEVKEILIRQISDKKQNVKHLKEDITNYFNDLNSDYAKWKLQETMKKIEHDKKIHQTIQYNNVILQEKDLKEEEEQNKLKTKEKEILDRISLDHVREREKLDKKKDAEMKIFNDQVEDVRQKDFYKKSNYLKEIENEKKNLEEFDKIMEKRDNDRTNLKDHVRYLAKIQELRQSIIRNVKDSDNDIKREMEMKYFREKEEIEKRNQLIEYYNQSKKKEQIEDIKKTIQSQQAEKINKVIQIKEMNKEFDNKLKSSLNDFIRQKEEIELKRKSEINKYKQELDKQIVEKNERLRKPIMGDLERLLNRQNL